MRRSLSSAVRTGNRPLSFTNGEHLDRADMKDIVVYRQAKKVEVDAPMGFAYSLDGEIIREPHFTVEIVPGAVTLAVPE